MSTVHFVFHIFIFCLFSTTLTQETVVQVRLKEAEMTDMSYNKYPVHFSKHRGTTFVNIKKTQWLYGVLREEKKGMRRVYSIELPEIGRLIYTNPDSEHPVVLDQVEHHHPCFVWKFSSLGNLKDIPNKNWLESLEEKKFMYQTLIGDVTAQMEIRDISERKNVEFVRALQFNAPRKKVIREILRHKNIF